jgi:hypothetical protein
MIDSSANSQFRVADTQGVYKVKKCSLLALLSSYSNQMVTLSKYCTIGSGWALDQPTDGTTLVTLVHLCANPALELYSASTVPVRYCSITMYIATEYIKVAGLLHIWSWVLAAVLFSATS